MAVNTPVCCVTDLKIEFYKTIDYPVKNKVYKVDTYKVVDYDKFYNNGLFNGWLLTTTKNYTVYYKTIPSYTWLNFESYIYKNNNVN